MKHEDATKTKLIRELKQCTTRLDILNNRLREKEKALQDLEEKYYTLFNNTRDIIYTHDLNGYFTSVNPAAVKIYGYTAAEFTRLNISRIIDKDYLSIAHKNIKETLPETFHTQPHEYLTYTKDGSPVWIEVTTHLLQYNGKATGIQGIARDITMRKDSEEALRASRNKLRNQVNYLNALIENMNELFYTYDSQANITFMNNKCYEVLGYTPEQIMGRNLFEFVPGDYLEIVQKGVESRLNKGETASYEVPVLHKDGSRRLIKLNVSPIVEDGSITGGMVLAEDITARKQAEKVLRLSEERFSRAFNFSPSLMAIYNFESGRIIDVNNSLLSVLGYGRDEIIGRTSLELNFWANLKERENIRKLIIECGYVRNMEISFYAKSGKLHVGLYSAEKIYINERLHLLVSINDITERKEMEREMARLERLHLVGEMAASIGHEVRNPMTTVRGFLQLLENKEDCSKYKEYYNLMIIELDRANSIITEFLSLAKNKRVDLKLQNLNSVITALLPLIKADAMVTDKCVNIRLGEIKDLLLDEKEICQLILNLVRNGLEAMAPGKCLAINTYMEEERVVLAVQDQGRGIEPGILERLGTPFLTTKDHGTGLGLAVCYSIAARHNAAIHVDTGSAGTTFRVRFKV